MSDPQVIPEKGQKAEIHPVLYGADDAPAGAGKGAQDFKSLAESLSAEGKKFEDPLFPASGESIKGIDLTYSDGSPMKTKWCRPAEISEALFGQSEPLFAGPYNQFGVQQGKLGDCWFLSVLADVATRPSCMEILVPDDNGTVGGFDKGIFHFRFWCRGKWIDVVVDDLLLCILNNYTGKIERTVFAKPTQEGGFVFSILEKAYAKLYGGYKPLKSGYGVDAMKDFTGGFVSTYSPKSKPMPNWKKVITMWKDNDAILASGTIKDKDLPANLIKPYDPNNPGKEGVSKDGIVTGHVYSLLDMQEVKNINNPEIVYTLLKLRNPWGNATEWSGDFRDDDDENWEKVTPNLRAVAEDRKADGEFWIKLEDWLPYQTALFCCAFGPNFSGEDGLFQRNGFVSWQVSGKFGAENSGNVNNKNDLVGKDGYFINVKPSEANAEPELNENGERVCGLMINMLYCNYTKSGHNPHIPAMGFYMLWSPLQNVEGAEFIKSAKKSKHMGPKGGPRDYNYGENLLPGTIFIAPWIDEADDSPYVLRIATEGEVKSGKLTKA